MQFLRKIPFVFYLSLPIFIVGVILNNENLATVFIVLILIGLIQLFLRFLYWLLKNIFSNKKIILALLSLIIIFFGYILFVYEDAYYAHAQNIRIAIDSDNPITRDFAVDLAKKYPGSFNFDQAVSIYKHIRSNWKYVDDPYDKEHFTPASRSIQLGLAGDCDDFAIVMAATLRAIGANTRIVLAYGETDGHAYAEVNVGDDPNQFLSVLQRRYSFFFIPLVYSLNYTPSDQGNWVNLDWFSNHPGGKSYEGKNGAIVYPNGSYQLVSWE